MMRNSPFLQVGPMESSRSGSSRYGSSDQIRQRKGWSSRSGSSDSSYLVGREYETARILKQVLYSPEPAAPGIKPEVIAIVVGTGGLGKTTLAQHVYNHAEVERCFTRSWACVSDNFDLVRVTRDILESLTGTAADVRDLAPLQRQLEEQLTGKRFLVVLDDTWDFSKQDWEKLMAPFSTGATGSKIILTTRDTRVAGVVPADHSFQLEPMPDDEAWSLFSCEVFRDGELSQHPELEAIGKEIVKKCGGWPSAIKTLSGLLRSERKEVEWERVRESSLWQLPEGREYFNPALADSFLISLLHRQVVSPDEACSPAATAGQTQVPNHRFTCPMSSNPIVVCLVSLIWIVLVWLDFKLVQSRYSH